MYACSTFHTFALFNERTKINLKCLLTSFSINFDHKLTAGERYVCVCLLRWPNGWIKRGRSAWRISFFWVSLFLGHPYIVSYNNSGQTLKLSKPHTTFLAAFDKHTMFLPVYMFHRHLSRETRCCSYSSY